MKFISAARNAAIDPATAPALRDTLKYLLKHGVGVRNACRIDDVLAYLNSVGHQLTRQQFQHRVLVPTREPPSTIFIASYGSFGRGGIYLIETDADTQPMLDFYEDRIRSERRHLAHLRSFL